MTSPAPRHEFFGELAAVLNAGESHSVLLCGNVHDLFHIPGDDGGRYAPLIDYLCERCRVPGLILLVYELNGPIRVLATADRDRLKRAWVAWKTGAADVEPALLALTSRDASRHVEQLESEFDALLLEAIGRPTVSLEFLRQLTICSRSRHASGRPYLRENLLVIIEAADLLLPAGDGDISHLAPSDRRRVSIAQDWFCDPGFLTGEDSVVLVAESRGLLHPRVARLPQVLTVEVPAPDDRARLHFIEWFLAGGEARRAESPPQVQLWAGPVQLGHHTAGLSIHALRQLLLRGAHSGTALRKADVVSRVETFIQDQLGEDVVEFKKPAHDLDDVVGFTRLKDFIRGELIPRFNSSGPDALPGAAVAGPIGGGKTFIFEAVAAALDLPVLVLKNIRSQWFGQTDVIFERLRRVLRALVKVLIFVDEADTQFGGVGAETHPTERRLTGKIQQMMSDPELRGRVIWLLMTARIHLLSADIRRPGRVGDLIIPVLDPEKDDRREFLRWVLRGVVDGEPDDASIDRLDQATPAYSAAAFASLRSHLKARSHSGPLSPAKIEEIVLDHIPPAIQETRRYQTLQALINCTRRSLLPDPDVTEEERQRWRQEIHELERRGIR